MVRVSAGARYSIISVVKVRAVVRVRAGARYCVILVVRVKAEVRVSG